MAHASYEVSKKLVFKGMWILAAVTLLEVLISLFGKGHLGINPREFDSSGTTIVLALVGLGLVIFSLYKAYYIVYNFMHMAHEVKGLRMTVLLPMLLLVWAIIAFFHEGNAWKESRADVLNKNAIELNELGKPIVGDVKKME